MSVEYINIKIELEESSNENSDENVSENGNQTEFVNIKVEPDLPDFDLKPDSPSESSEKWIPPSFMNYEPGCQPNVDIEVVIKQEPEELPPAEEDLGFIVPDERPPVLSTTYISDVSEAVLSLNSTVDGKYMCPICHKRFASKANVQRHMLLHTREKLECATCFRQFVKAAHYERHLLTHSTEKRFKCDECGKMFRTPSNLEQHKRIHLAIKPFECQKCTRQFAVKANLLKHQGKGKCKRPNHDPIICTICNKTFKKEFLLKSHLRRHTTEKPFVCDKCKMAFKYKSTLIRHVQLHNGIKPYSCKVCRKKFTHAGLIKPHMRRHTGEKPYACPVCNKLFAHKHNMQRHTLRHAKVKHLVCEVCNKTFPKESRLKYHMRTHTNAKPFVCTVCGKTFSHRQNIIRHYGRKHPNDRYECTDTDASVAKDVWEKVRNKNLEIKVDFCEVDVGCDVKIEISDPSDDEVLAKIKK